MAAVRFEARAAAPSPPLPPSLHAAVPAAAAALAGGTASGTHAQPHEATLPRPSHQPLVLSYHRHWELYGQYPLAGTGSWRPAGLPCPAQTLGPCPEEAGRQLPQPCPCPPHREMDWQSGCEEPTAHPPPRPWAPVAPPLLHLLRPLLHPLLQ